MDTLSNWLSFLPLRPLLVSRVTWFGILPLFSISLVRDVDKVEVCSIILVFTDISYEVLCPELCYEVFNFKVDLKPMRIIRDSPIVGNKLMLTKIDFTLFPHHDSKNFCPPKSMFDQFLNLVDTINSFHDFPSPFALSIR